MTGNTALIIEDNDATVRAIADQLQDLGLTHESCDNGKDGLAKALSENFALVLIDLGLPLLGGAEVCRQLRAAKPSQPIIVLTGQQEELHAVLLLELGADDYIRKPLSAMEFRARVRALLRRAETHQTEVAEVATKTFSYGELFVDFLARVVTVRGTEVSLTPIEFDLLALFCRNPNQVFHRDQIIRDVWGFSTSTYEQNVRAHMSRLRTKLTEAGATRDYIITQRGHGYRLAPLGDA